MGTGKDRSPIEGRLGSVSLQDLVQMLALARRTATLCLERGRERGFIFFREGQVVHVSAGAHEGENALARLLEWTHADFAVEHGVRSLPQVSITASTEALLLEALRRLDERTANRRAEEPTATTPRRRYPRPPRRREKARTPWAGAALGLLIAVTVGVLAAGDVLFGAPWAELPAHQSPAAESPSRPASSLVAPLGVATSDDAPPASLSLPETVALEPLSAEPIETSEPAPPARFADSPPAREGYLTVVADPWAFITVNGSLIGETPLREIALPPGKHELTLTHPNVVGAIRAEVDIAPGAELTRRFSFADVGYLLVLAESWADVEVDGRPVGQTPLPRLAVPVGPHVIRFRHPELGTRERSGVVRSGETTRVHAHWSAP